MIRKQIDDMNFAVTGKLRQALNLIAEEIDKLKGPKTPVESNDTGAADLHYSPVQVTEIKNAYITYCNSTVGKLCDDWLKLEAENAGLKEQIERIDNALPTTYYAGMLIEVRVEMIASAWCRAMKINQELEAENAGLNQRIAEVKCRSAEYEDKLRELEKQLAESRKNEEHDFYAWGECKSKLAEVEKQLAAWEANYRSIQARLDAANGEISVKEQIIAEYNEIIESLRDELTSANVSACEWKNKADWNDRNEHLNQINANLLSKLGAFEAELNGKCAVCGTKLRDMLGDSHCYACDKEAAEADAKYARDIERFCMLLELMANGKWRAKDTHCHWHHESDSWQEAIGKCRESVEATRKQAEGA